MVKIDIEKLTESELIDLNHKIVMRLKFLSQMRSQGKMLEFSLGERVAFHPEGHPQLFGIIAKYNKKTITVITENGEHWNVSPVLLRKTNEDKKSQGNEQNIIPFQKSRS